ncbi:BCCT family transporter [Gilvimarinus agarilyticus]|uniref:BCCT family transporter n=1 Tax=unclassified Gilvimarinus TaxID=2642066 RepID=UPI001C092FE0|nr:MULTISPECIES: BCCT family transporter [unclassified Gilvimarinus]MBU2885180.1 BCCT family transporter [Gilvimarinus agarilyticus]MDO6570079.1 BCCT family transporter [Gilvimarinus sp. 2_MG-2023]MDO6745630.1 BCCT family transporter [Gilvimarinus sp. 1_MG-2023]
MLDALAKRMGLSAIPQIFFISVAVVVLFVGFAVPFHDEFAQFFDRLGQFTFTRFGWFYVVSVSGLLLFLLWLSASRYGHIRLGPEDEGPEYNTVTWFCMLFAAGIGTILMFWGVAEPMYHFAQPPFADIDPESVASAKLAMQISMFHYGLHTWTIFTLPALAIGYFAYRQGLPMRISSVFYSVLGDRIYGPIGWAIDIIAVLGTLFGVAVSVGLGTLQINSGLNYLVGMPDTTLAKMAIVAVITAVATVSVALGLDRGIKRLSEFNIIIAIAILLFIWVCGPTLFVTEGMVQNVGMYLDKILWFSFWTEAYSESDWQRSWTVFYFAWTISWAPYVGIFIARISKGRTIRQFILGALGAPLMFTLVWFSVFGLSAIDLELNHDVAIAAEVQKDVSVALFSFLENFPLPKLISTLALIVIVVFITTSADSAALVIDLLSRKDKQPSKTIQRIFWTLLLGATAATLLLGGGLKALQNVITALGFPFCVLLVFMAVSLVRALHADYLGYSMKELSQGKAPGIHPMGSLPREKKSHSEKSSRE